MIACTCNQIHPLSNPTTNANNPKRTHLEYQHLLADVLVGLPRRAYHDAHRVGERLLHYLELCLYSLVGDRIG